MTAEIYGGFWNNLPVKDFRTFFKLTYDSIGPWSLTIPTYYLPADCCDLTNLVALNNLIILPFYANQKTSCYLRIQCSWMTCFLDLQYFFNPGHDLMRAWVWWFIQINNAIFKIFFKWSLQWHGSIWNRSVVTIKNIHFVIVF